MTEASSNVLIHTKKKKKRLRWYLGKHTAEGYRPLPVGVTASRLKTGRAELSDIARLLLTRWTVGRCDGSGPDPVESLRDELMLSSSSPVEKLFSGWIQMLRLSRSMLGSSCQAARLQD